VIVKPPPFFFFPPPPAPPPSLFSRFLDLVHEAGIPEELVSDSVREDPKKKKRRSSPPPSSFPSLFFFSPSFPFPAGVVLCSHSCARSRCALENGRTRRK